MTRRKVLPHLLNYVMLTLMILAVISLVGLPMIVKNYVDYAYAQSGNEFVRIYFTTILYICGVVALIVLLELRRIFKTCVTNNPFVIENVYSLKRIAYCSFAITLMFVTKAFLFLTFLTLIVVFVFALAGLFCLVLADVFEEAVQYKLDNDLTI